MLVIPIKQVDITIYRDIFKGFRYLQFFLLLCIRPVDIGGQARVWVVMGVGEQGCG